MEARPTGNVSVLNAYYYLLAVAQQPKGILQATRGVWYSLNSDERDHGPTKQRDFNQGT